MGVGVESSLLSFLFCSVSSACTENSIYDCGNLEKDGKFITILLDKSNSIEGDS